MIIFSEQRLIPTDVNMMTIKDPNDLGYYYIHRSLYDQAVILNDLYSEDPTMLIMAITNKTESRDDVVFFMENTPAPISILGPFLLLVKGQLDDLKDMVGAIHVMSGPLNFRKMLNIPFDMRNMQPMFSLSIRDEYQLAWDRFFITAIPYSDDLFMPKQVQVEHPTAPLTNKSALDYETASMVQAANLSAYANADANEAVDDVDFNDLDSIANAVASMVEADNDYDADNFDINSAQEGIEDMDPELLTNAVAAIDWDAVFGASPDDDEEEVTEEVTYVPEPEPEPEPEPVVEKKTGVDALLDLV